MKLLTVRDLKEELKFLKDDDMVFLPAGDHVLRAPYLYTCFVVKEDGEYVEGYSTDEGAVMALIVQ